MDSKTPTSIYDLLNTLILLCISSAYTFTKQGDRQLAANYLLGALQAVYCTGCFTIEDAEINYLADKINTFMLYEGAPRHE